jgi:SAM-dependent methyltransferase
MLPYVTNARRALVIGDGDGRFLTNLACNNHALAVDALDISRKMIDVANKRLNASRCPNPQRIHLQHCDIRTEAPPNDGYDLISTHFFFDVFPTAELGTIIDRIAGWTTPGALWIISEFDVPASGWKRLNARMWLRIMYAFFRITTNLRNQRLPSWRRLLREAGFAPRTQISYKGGFIVSELWQRTGNGPDAYP